MKPSTAWVRFNVLGAVLLASCTVNHRPSVDSPKAVAPLEPKIPMHVGIYFSPRFVQTEHVRKTGSHNWIVAIGTVSAELLTRLTAQAIERTTVLKEPPHSAGEHDFDAVIVPSIEHFDFRLGTDSDSDRYRVAYRSTVYSRRGVPVASWVVDGNAPDESAFYYVTYLERDLADAAQKYVAALQANLQPLAEARARKTSRVPSSLAASKFAVSGQLADSRKLDPGLVKALAEANILAVEVVVRTQSSRPLRVRTSDMRLATPGGTSLEPEPPSFALRAVDRDSNDGTLAALFLGAPIGTLVHTLHVRADERKRGEQLDRTQQTLFGERTVSAGQDAQGLVFFKVPPQTGVHELTLGVWLVDEAASDGVWLEAPVGDQVGPVRL